MSRNSKQNYNNSSASSSSSRHHTSMHTMRAGCKNDNRDNYDPRLASDKSDRGANKSVRKLWKVIKDRRKERNARKRLFELSEYQAMNEATQEQLKDILQNDEFLCDIPYDCTLEELKGEIALAKGHATTLYIHRDGLSTLKVVLPQENPTIANLKRGIEAISRIQLQREQRHEDRLRRRTQQQFVNSKHNNVSDSDSDVDADDDKNCDNIKSGETEDDDRKQVSTVPTKSRRRRGKKSKNELTFRSAGELVYSEALSGQHHRPNVSWRFLWRAYGLLNVRTKLPLNDTNGRILLSECGIENGDILKFCNREKYFGKKRQR